MGGDVGGDRRRRQGRAGAGVVRLRRRRIIPAMSRGAPGPNDPCWCGSGTKYKKCHQARDLLKRLNAPAEAVVRALPGRVQPGTVSPMRPVPAHIPRPDYAATGKPARRRQGIEIKSPEQIQRMRAAGAAARRVLEEAKRAVRPGIPTDEIDAVVHAACIAEGGYPSPLNYHGFPKSVCTSVNEVICHGIPDSRLLLDGEIVNIDVTIFLDGVHGDCNETVPVGAIDAESTALIAMARACLHLGIRQVAPGRRIRDIGRAIQAHAEAAGYGVVRAFVGHGIGELFHQDPQVPHYDDPGATTLLVPGMTFTIEPMINAGTWQHIGWDDGWTAVTADGRRSAQFEHTVLVTADGVEVLTLGDGERLG